MNPIVTLLADNILSTVVFLLQISLKLAISLIMFENYLRSLLFPLENFKRFVFHFRCITDRQFNILSACDNNFQCITDHRSISTKRKLFVVFDLLSRSGFLYRLSINIQYRYYSLSLIPTFRFIYLFQYKCW